MPKYWKDEPWANKPEILLDSVKRLYQEAVAIGKIKNAYAVTAKKVMANRKWVAAVNPQNLLKAIVDFNMTYVPAGITPGPAFLFPIRDVTDTIRRAHLRVIDETVYGLRYISIVNREEFVGPAWLGTDDDALETIINSGEVLVMEGPFDLLAIRTLEPRLPSLCSLTKRLSDQHLDYLRILGVKKIHVMFDNEASGRGQQAAEVMQTKVKDFEIIPITCPAHDPAEALKSPQKMESLRAILRSILPTNIAPVLIMDEDDF